MYFSVGIFQRIDLDMQYCVTVEYNHHFHHHLQYFNYC